MSEWHKFSYLNPPPPDEILMIHERKAHLYYVSSNKVLEAMESGETLSIRDVCGGWIMHATYEELSDCEWKVL